MKRLFRRPQLQSKASQEGDLLKEPKSEADLGCSLSFDADKTSSVSSSVSNGPGRLVPTRERTHQRAWSLESDFRISRVLLSPLVPHERGAIPLDGACWKPLSKQASIPSVPSLSSATSSLPSLPGVPTSQSHLSTAGYSQHHHDDVTMPSWPSSILCRREHSLMTSPAHSINHYYAQSDSPRSPISDEATENSHSPLSSALLSPSTSITPSNQSPLTLDRAFQVDEFGRMILTISTDFKDEKTPFEGRQVRFKDAATFPAADSTHAVSAKEDSQEQDTPASTASRDTFGNPYKDYWPVETTTSPIEEVGDSSLAFDVQPGTPLLLDPQSFQSSRRRNCSDVLPNGKDSLLFRFPALCEAAIALKPQRKSCLVEKDFKLNTALLSPIELDSERLKSIMEAPKSYHQDIKFEPWRSSRYGGLPISTSDSQLSRCGERKKIFRRPRAATNVESAKKWRLGSRINNQMCPFPNPHLSLDLDRDHQMYYAPSLLTEDSDTISHSNFFEEVSPQESNASVRSIIDQQKITMENLTKAGFWHQKVLQSSNEDQIKEAQYKLPPLPQEDLVTKVSQWAWLLSSENERGEEEDDQGQVLRSSSPLGCLIDAIGTIGTIEEEEEEECDVTKKSWEWLASEEEIQQDSFDSNETSQGSTVLGNTDLNDTKGDVIEAGVGLGLQDTLPMEKLIDHSVDNSASKASENQIQTEEDSSMISTPDLGKRESRTTAAIEALLTQIQRSQEPNIALPTDSNNGTRKIGTSYLYHQILKNIEEDERK